MLAFQTLEAAVKRATKGLLKENCKMARTPERSDGDPEGHWYSYIGEVTCATGKTLNLLFWIDNRFFNQKANRARISVQANNESQLYNAIPWLKESTFPSVEQSEIDIETLTLKYERLDFFDAASPYIENCDGIDFATYLVGNPASNIGIISSAAAVFVHAAATATSQSDFDQKRSLNTRTRSPTEKKQLVLARLGQGLFRDALINKWRGQCAVGKCSFRSILRASHIKPWRASDDAERLDAHNGLLLDPTLDSLFDGGWITFEETGKLLVSPLLAFADVGVVLKNARLRMVGPQTEKYLRYHRKFVFRDGHRRK